MPDLGRKQYYSDNGLTVVVGAVNQEVDILAALVASSRAGDKGAATYLLVETDVAITMKINATTADDITVDTTDGFTSPGGVMSISKIYLSHTIPGSSGSGDATVQIFAA